jgi:hypothetical protein
MKYQVHIFHDLHNSLWSAHLVRRVMIKLQVHSLHDSLWALYNVNASAHFARQFMKRTFYMTLYKPCMMELQVYSLHDS